MVSLRARQLATLAIHDITNLPPAPIQDSGVGVHPQGERQLIALFRYLWPQSTSQIFPLENLLTVLFNNSFKKTCAKKGVTNVNTGLLNYGFFLVSKTIDIHHDHSKERDLLNKKRVV